VNHQVGLQFRNPRPILQIASLRRLLDDLRILRRQARDRTLQAADGRQVLLQSLLIAVAEVRDLTPLRDGSGRVTSLPELEQVLGACLDGIRRARSDQPRWQRLEWNRVML
jgi:hypothetical protein